ncbi:MAG: hypothetical protein GXP48_00830 [Acidobacteria bacterium]|nr:hypothetical protein [Acidobacteriota bacterium]
MRKPLLYWLLGVGKVPPVTRAALDDEGIEVMDDGIRVTVGYCDYSAPGKRFVRKSESGRGAIVVTRQRLIGFAYSHKILNVRLDDPRLDSLVVRLDGPECLAIDVDPSVFHPDQSGRVVYRFHTPRAMAVLERIQRNRSGT